MSLNEKMDSYTTSQFLSTDRFAETVTFYPGGKLGGSSQTVSVVWDADALPGTNEQEGDGVTLERQMGRRIRESIKIECDIDLGVNDQNDPPDRFVRGDEIALVKRVMGRDDGGMMTVLCIRMRETYNRSRRRTG